MKAYHLIRLARPTHWVKNLVVLLPIPFAMRAGDLWCWIWALQTVAAFCLSSSAVYVMNDLRDAAQDRLHPAKRHRPIAAGLVGTGSAIAWALLLAGGGLAIAWSVSRIVLLVVATYLVLQVAYTFHLKRRMILDVICIAMGFVLRAVAGAAAIGAEPSVWLVICAFTLCLFMGFCKRRNEAASLEAGGHAEDHRATLAGYTSELLTHLITLSAGVAIVSYLLYAVSPRTVDHFGTNALVYSLPLVIYGVTRFAMLSMAARYDGPTEMILRDRPLQVTGLLWLAMEVVIIYWGRDVYDWAQATLAS